MLGFLRPNHAALSSILEFGHDPRLERQGVGVTERVGLDLLPEEGWFIVRGILKPKNIQPSWSLCRCGLGDGKLYKGPPPKIRASA
jgi:hypothetical protein